MESSSSNSGSHGRQISSNSYPTPTRRRRSLPLNLAWRRTMIPKSAEIATQSTPQTEASSQKPSTVPRIKDDHSGLRETRSFHSMFRKRAENFGTRKLSPARPSSQGESSTKKEHRKSRRAMLAVARWIKQNGEWMRHLSRLSVHFREPAPPEEPEQDEGDYFECLICAEMRHEDERGPVPTVRQTRRVMSNTRSSRSRSSQRFSLSSTVSSRYSSVRIHARSTRRRSSWLSWLGGIRLSGLSASQPEAEVETPEPQRHRQSLRTTEAAIPVDGDASLSVPGDESDGNEEVVKPDYCKSCITNDVLSQHGNWPVKYVDRVQDWSLADLRELLNNSERDVLRMFERKSVEWGILQSLNQGTETIFHCPTPDCHGIVVCDKRIVEHKFNWWELFWNRCRNSPDERRHHCQECDIAHCVSCRNEWTFNDSSHANQSCSTYKRQLDSMRNVQTMDRLHKEWVKAHDTRKCPGCKVIIEKNKGCPHMKCTRCRHQFCWRCGREWRKSCTGNCRVYFRGLFVRG